MRQSWISLSVLALVCLFALSAKAVVVMPTPNDTIVFDLNTATIETIDSETFIDIPVSIHSSNNQINAIDFWFQFDLTKLEYVSTSGILSSLDVFSNFNNTNLFLSNTSSTTFSTVYVPTFEPLLSLRFRLLTPCTEVDPVDFYSATALLNGIVSSSRFEESQSESPAISIDSQSPYCSGYEQLFSFASTYNGSAINDYFWDFGDTQTASGQNVAHVYSDFGSYTTTLTILTETGCEYTFSTDIEVLPTPVASFTSSFNEVSNIVSFTNTSSIVGGVITGYFWDFGDNTTSVETNPQHTFPTPAFYNVTLTTTSSEGCESSVVIFTSATTSVEEQGQWRNVNVYPVPAQSHIFIQSATTFSVEVKDLLGRTVLPTFSVFGGKEAIAVTEGLANGVYILHFSNPTYSFSKQFVIEK
jgi:PKD repeat protein